MKKHFRKGKRSKKKISVASEPEDNKTESEEEPPSKKKRFKKKIEVTPFPRN